MPDANDLRHFESKEDGLFNLAVKLGEYGLFCRCCALIWTSREIQDYANRHMRHLGENYLEGLIYIFTRYRNIPNDYDHFNKNAILGHALILKFMGTDAANQIAQSYLSEDGSTNKLCAAFLLWVGDNPELEKVEEKIVISKYLAENLFIGAHGILYDRINICKRNNYMWERLSGEMLSRIRADDHRSDREL